MIWLWVITSCSTVKESFSIENENFSFRSDILPGMDISGITAIENGDTILYITSVKMFSNWSNGWTEGFFEASGKYIMHPHGSTYKLIEIDPFELWDITSGEIRYHDNYYRGDDGLWKVKNRVDRLKEISRILIDDFNMQEHVEDFSININPFLFPELYGFEEMELNGLMPARFTETELEPEIIKNIGIDWRSDYTRSVFPEQIWELRDSGTLYRDVQEAPDIFRAIYNLKYYFRNRELIL
jgi:hypothetical protein